VSLKMVRSMQSVKRQRGVGVLLVAIVLLGIVTVMTLFSLSAAMYETRTATNESRSKLTYQAAQAGLDHGLEFIKANTGNLTACWLFPGMSTCTPAGQTRRWTRCLSTDTNVPCGTIQPGVATSTLRANYFYYSDANLTSGRAAPADAKSLDFTLTPVSGATLTQVQAISKIGDFPVDYEVNALLCLFDTVTPSNQCLTPAEFSTACGSGNTPTCGSNGYTANQFSTSGLFAVTLVSRSRLATAATAVGSETENAQTVLKMTTASYPLIGSAPDVPLVASSDVTGLGNGDIVANPNGGGTGVPLSIWSAGVIHIDNTSGGSNASFATCFPDEFFKTGTPTMIGGSNVCPQSGNGKCSCSKIANMVGNNGSPFGLGVLSGHFGGNEVTGADILGVGVGGYLPDNQFFPLHVQNTAGAYLNNPPNQFDNTPFEYVFSQNVADSNSVLLPSANSATVDAATDWLETTPGIKHWADCGTLTSADTGFYWHRPGDGTCTLPNAQVGTPSAPVVLITQSDFRLSGNTVFFGIIFVRSPALVNQSVVSSGTYNIDVQGSPQVYGAMVLEGSISPGGSMQLIYDANVLYNVVHGPPNISMGTLPGSWSDAGRVDMSGGSAGTYSE